MSAGNPTSLAEVATPALLLDRDRLEANIRRMEMRATQLGVELRPHLKTTKSVDVARLAAPSGRITVSTLREAEYFAQHGFRDIFYAVAINPQKLGRVGALLAQGVRLLISLDDPAVAAQVAQAGRALGLVFPVMIEIDSGEERSGVDAASPDLLAIVDALRSGAQVAGVFTHGGHSYLGRSIEEHQAVAEQERVAVTTAAARLRAHGCGNDLIVSLGSTPTVNHARNLTGVTEARPGVYMVYDLFQWDVGACGPDDLALSVLTSVIGQHPSRSQLVIDAGAIALSKDLGTHGPEDHAVPAYGLIADAQTGQLIADLHVHTVYQEHGIVRSQRPIDFSAFPVGRQLRVYMNHACLTAAAFDQFHVVQADNPEIALWDRVNGW
jgi:D-serine deaminase-like pyridoxal phosphate-dependent protein